MIRNLLLVGLGGALGSALRYLTALGVARLPNLSFFWGTFLANVLGCLLIGICFALANRFAWFTPEWRMLLVTGFCGGYTTFSTFAYENLNLLQNQQYTTFAAYALGSLGLGIGAVAVGFWVVNQ